MFLIGSPVCYLATISAGSPSCRRPVHWTSDSCYRNVLIYDADQFLYIELTMAMCSQNLYRLADFALIPTKDVWQISFVLRRLFPFLELFFLMYETAAGLGGMGRKVYFLTHALKGSLCITLLFSGWNRIVIKRKGLTIKFIRGQIQSLYQNS